MQCWKRTFPMKEIVDWGSQLCSCLHWVKIVMFSTSFTSDTTTSKQKNVRCSVCSLTDSLLCFCFPTWQHKSITEKWDFRLLLMDLVCLGRHCARVSMRVPNLILVQVVLFHRVELCRFGLWQVRECSESHNQITWDCSEIGKWKEHQKSNTRQKISNELWNIPFNRTQRVHQTQSRCWTWKMNCAISFPMNWNITTLFSKFVLNKLQKIILNTHNFLNEFNSEKINLHFLDLLELQQDTPIQIPLSNENIIHLFSLSLFFGEKGYFLYFGSITKSKSNERHSEQSTNNVLADLFKDDNLDVILQKKNNLCVSKGRQKITLLLYVQCCWGLQEQLVFVVWDYCNWCLSLSHWWEVAIEHVMEPPFVVDWTLDVKLSTKDKTKNRTRVESLLI